MEKIKTKLFYIRNNISNCEYCDERMNKSQISNSFFVNVNYVFVAKNN